MNAYAVRLASLTYTILAFELTLIRWMSQQIRVFAYLNNLLLLAAFLGLGVGPALSRHGSRLVRLTLPLSLALAAILARSREFGLMYLSFPDRSIALWGADGLRVDETFAGNVVIIVALFTLVAFVFATLGARLGELFEQRPPLSAYSIDLAGSILGVATATALAALRTSPPIWLLLSLAPLLLWHARTAVSALSLAGTVAFGAASIDGALFSPYNRLDVKQATDGSYVIAANRDNHQHIHDFSAARPHPVVVPNAARNPLPAAIPPSAPADGKNRPLTAAEAHTKRIYELPFEISRRRRRALVAGAGTGNDVAAALRRGFGEVVAVEIDPLIRDLGTGLHPERPFQNPRVTTITADARTYLERSGGEFDAVCFGLLDSHAMFSAMSTLRLDNYVYTVDALRRAWERVGEGGSLTISFMIHKQRFVAERLARNLYHATGGWPVVVTDRNGAAYAFIRTKGIPDAEVLRKAGDLPVLPHFRSQTQPSTDDWPFLYINPAIFPTGYVAILALVLCVSLIAVRVAYGGRVFTRRQFDVPLFLLGAAFLLLETRAVTSLSLLFGSTWTVNAAVFGGVLLIALGANAFVARFGVPPPALAISGLFLALAANYAISNTWLAAMPLTPARAFGVAANVLPIGFAGVLFSVLLSRSSDGAASLGSNLLGAVAGGVIEYGSTMTGLRALTLVAAAIYAAAVVAGWRRLAKRE